MSKVLFIEDDELMSEMYSSFLREPMFTTEIYSSGKDGIARAIEWQPEIILLDVMMPVMNGIEALDLLKANSATASIPVIMLSNLYDHQFMQQAIEKGASEYLIKSELSGDQVRTKINEIIAKKSSETVQEA